VSLDNATTVAVIDFRRHRMVLQWHALAGTWDTYENEPALVHGVAYIHPGQPNICVFGQGGRLRLQIGLQKYILSENSPLIKCIPAFMSFGLRQRFIIESSTGDLLYKATYWKSQTEDFYLWLAEHAANPNWRNNSALKWSEGVTPAAIRAV